MEGCCFVVVFTGALAEMSGLVAAAAPMAVTRLPTLNEQSVRLQGLSHADFTTEWTYQEQNLADLQRRKPQVREASSPDPGRRLRKGAVRQTFCHIRCTVVTDGQACACYSEP